MKLLPCLIVLLGLLLPSGTRAQQNREGGNIAVGHWRHHLPNNRLLGVAETPTRIIGATEYGLVVFNKADNSVESFNKVHGLSDFGISAMAWSSERQLLVIGYDNGNIDVVQNGTVINIPDIMQASILGSKRVNNVLMGEGSALLSCDFGVVELDLSGFLIRDTWYIGPFGSMVNVNELALSDNRLYAATNAGLLSANPGAANLADYRNWQREQVSGQADEVFTLVAGHEGNILANRTTPAGDSLYLFDGQQWQVFRPGDEPEPSTTWRLRSSQRQLLVATGNRLDVYDGNLQLTESIDSYFPGMAGPRDALLAEDQTLWIADRQFGLVRRRGPSEFDRIVLPGPAHATAFGLASGGGRVWVAPGSRSYGGDNAWNQNGFFVFENGQWRNYDRFRFPLLENIIDLIGISVDPANPEKAYGASWLGGMVKFRPDSVVAVFDETNSTLRRRTDFDDRLRIGGTATDRHGNVWVTNSEVEKPISVRKPGGQWMAFGSGGVTTPQTVVGELIIDRHDQKWILLPRNGIMLFRENSLDHAGGVDARRLTTQANLGNLPNINVHSLAMDHNGYIWVGTEEGVAVFFSPQRAFSGEPFNAARIVVEQDDGFAGYLLETETVTAIEVDGSNKKWFGTSRSGAFLLSADGRETIFHFNRANSPLPSNNILDITINGQNGEVFFATDRGLVSFRGLATGATARHSDVVAFPNPVRPGYAGYISVKGLVRNARVKITDINGNLVWETIAEGGQAVWNGQDLFGRRPSTGVYLVFSTNDDGEETMVTKILFVN